MSQTHPKSFRDHKWDLFQFISGDLDPNKQRIRKFSPFAAIYGKKRQNQSKLVTFISS